MNPSKYFGVYQKGNYLYTKSLVKGQVVYGERLEGEYREWIPKRSKLGSSLMKGLKLFPFKEDTTVLYLGASSGTTCSHLSDICTKGMIFGVEVAPRIFYKFVELSKTRSNLFPILESANDVEKYAFVPPVDVVFQDISQKDQVRLFLKNCDAFLKSGGYGLLSVKARSIDVTKNPMTIFSSVKAELVKKFEVVDERRLEPFERDHIIFLVKKR